MIDLSKHIQNLKSILKEDADGTGHPWESGTTRGKGNPISSHGEWESGASRGKANPINEEDPELTEYDDDQEPDFTHYDGKTLMNIDIQPEYADGINFHLPTWGEMCNEHRGTLIFLYNGYDTLGMISEEEYKHWLYEQAEITEETMDRAIFYDKGYAFFRYCMDNGLGDDEIADLVKFMLQRDINDSRDMTQEFWQEYMELHNNIDIKDLLEPAQDAINIPALMDFLQSYNNIVICGGGENECLKEVEIALKALNKPYDVYRQYVYEKMEPKLSEAIKKFKKLIVP